MRGSSDEEVEPDSESTGGTIGFVDGPSERYLARVAADIGYMECNMEPKPTVEIFSEAEIPLHHCGYIELDENEFARLYNFPSTHGGLRKSDGSAKYERTRTTETDSEPNADAPTRQFHYAVDWPVEQDGLFKHKTWVFRDRPDRETIRRTRCISNIIKQIEVNAVSQHYRCKECDQLVHWTDTTRCDLDREATIEERALMLTHQVCSFDELPDYLSESTSEGTGLDGETPPVPIFSD